MTERDGAEGDVIYDFRDVTASGAIINACVCHADPEEYPGGVHYYLHYGYPDEDHPIVRYDNENIEGDPRTTRGQRDRGNRVPRCWRAPRTLRARGERS